MTATARTSIFHPKKKQGVKNELFYHPASDNVGKGSRWIGVLCIIPERQLWNKVKGGGENEM